MCFVREILTICVKDSFTLISLKHCSEFLMSNKSFDLFQAVLNALAKGKPNVHQKIQIFLPESKSLLPSWEKRSLVFKLRRTSLPAPVSECLRAVEFPRARCDMA